MSLIFPDGAIRVTTPEGSEKIMGARLSDGKIIYITHGDFIAGLARTSDLNAKQATLISGTNVKTINGISILGPGNIALAGGGSGSETKESILEKLGATVLTGSNTGDQDISGKVDKVAGKQLSTEDYTTAEKEKLAGLSDGGGPGLSLGETSVTAYRGDRGKTAYDHSQATGNPHGATTDTISEGVRKYFSNALALAVTLTGFTAGTVHAAVAATDTILQAFQKIAGSITAILASLALKSDVSLTLNARTANYTLVLSDNGKLIQMNLSGANTLTIPTNTAVAFPIGTQIIGTQEGAGLTTITPASGVTLDSSGGKLKTTARYATFSLIKKATNTWLVTGDLTT